MGCACSRFKKQEEDPPMQISYPFESEEDARSNRGRFTPMSTREEVLARGGTYVNENGEPTEEPKPKEDDINDEARDVISELRPGPGASTEAILGEHDVISDSTSEPATTVSEAPTGTNTNTRAETGESVIAVSVMHIVGPTLEAFHEEAGNQEGSDVQKQATVEVEDGHCFIQGMSIAAPAA